MSNRGSNVTVCGLVHNAKVLPLGLVDALIICHFRHYEAMRVTTHVGLRALHVLGGP